MSPLTLPIASSPFPTATLAVQLPDALQNLPWLVQIPVALAFVAGLVLWLAGRRLIRPVTIMVGLGVGGLLGFLVLPVLMPTVAISPYLGLAAGAATGLTTALLLYQVATAVTFGSAIGAGCGITAAAVLGTALALPASAQLDDQPLPPLPPDSPGQIGGGEQPTYVPPPAPWNPRIEPLPEPEVGPEGADVENPGVIRAKPVVVVKPKPAVAAKPTKPATVKKSTTTEGGHASAKNTRSSANGEVRASAQSAAGKVGEFWHAARSTWSGWWESVPEKNKPWIMGATAAGVTAGTVLGLLLPAWSAGAVTALAGAAIWLPAALWLGMAWSVPGFSGKGGGSVQSLSPGGWIAVWLVVAVIGVACQWYGLMPGTAKGKGKAKGKKKKPKDEEE
jgi:hypothetical protein